MVFLGRSAPEHRNPQPGLEQAMTLRMIRPLAACGFEVFFVSRWPGMDPATTFADVAARHAVAIGERFSGPVPVIGHSTGGSLLLQLLADRPEVVTRAVVASAAYALGPVAKQAQREDGSGADVRYSSRHRSVARVLPPSRVLRLVGPLATGLSGLPISNPATPHHAEAEESSTYGRLPQIPTRPWSDGAHDYFAAGIWWSTAEDAEARLSSTPTAARPGPAREFVRDVIGFLRAGLND